MTILPPLQTYDEKLLLSRLAAGDMEAFNMLYKHMQPRLLRRLAPFRQQHDIEEVIQEVFLRVWIKKDLMPGVRSLEGFLVKLARDKLVDLKRKSIATTNREKLAAPATEDEITPVITTEYKEFYEAAMKAISKLPPRQRKIYELRVLEDYSLNDIAAHLNLSKAVVIKQLYLASKIVRAEVKQMPLPVILVFAIGLSALLK